MDPLTDAFNDRLQEIESYLAFLEALQREAFSGPPRIGGSAVTSQQQQILYSAVYLQLYNLVESTVISCINAVAAAAANGGRWRPGDLSDRLRREWVRVMAQTHVNLNIDNRLGTAVAFCERLIRLDPITAWEFETGGGGNWDDHEIEVISDRIGCDLTIIDRTVLTGIKMKVRDDKRPLELVKYLRNRLAHGSISFAECGDGVVVTELRDLTDKIAAYLLAVLTGFRQFIDSYEFLDPARRPPAVGAVP